MRDSLVARGWEFLFHDVEVMHVQVDLLMRAPGSVLTLIEVKSGSEMAHVSWRQRERLQRVCAFLGQWEAVDLQIAFVTGSKLRLLAGC